MNQKLFDILAIVSAMVSAGLWFWSASLKPVLPMAYLSGPPAHIVDQLKWQGRLNAFAAFATGLSGLFQALSLFLRP